MKQNSSGFSIASMLSGILVLFLAVIVFFALFSLADIQNYETYYAVLVFSSINLFVVFVLALVSSYLSRNIAFASLASIWATTIIYSLFQFIHLGFSYRVVPVNSYILYQLIVLFVYFLIVIPAALIGARKNN